MKLTELNPKFTYSGEGRRGMGIRFDCPIHRGGDCLLGVDFANPIDGGPPSESDRYKWNRTGETFDTLTLTPSVDASQHGCWHGFITNGEIR